MDARQVAGCALGWDEVIVNFWRVAGLRLFAGRRLALEYVQVCRPTGWLTTVSRARLVVDEIERAHEAAAEGVKLRHMQQGALEGIAGKLEAESSGGRLGRWLAWCPLVATTAQVVPCVFLISLSGYRVAIGGLALFCASISGPFERFHEDTVRLPFFLIAGGLSLMNLLLYFYARRRRLAPEARWRIQPISASERRTQRFQFYSSWLTLAMIAGDFLTHWVHGF